MPLPRIPASERPLEDVAVYGVQKRKGDRIKRPWIARWSLDGRQRSRSFRTKAEADRYRAGLLLSQQRGERFDDETGEPVSWAPSPGSLRTHDWARQFIAEQWHEWQPRTRSSAVEALARFVPMVAASAAPSPPRRSAGAPDPMAPCRRGASGGERGAGVARPLGPVARPARLGRAVRGRHRARPTG